MRNKDKKPPKFPSLLTKDTPEWRILLKALNHSQNSNPQDLLCLKCWQVLNYE